MLLIDYHQRSTAIQRLHLYDINHAIPFTPARTNYIDTVCMLLCFISWMVSECFICAHLHKYYNSSMKTRVFLQRKCCRQWIRYLIKLSGVTDRSDLMTLGKEDVAVLESL